MHIYVKLISSGFAVRIYKHGLSTEIPMYGELMFWLGDNKEQNMIGGFRGVFVCRFCHTQMGDSKQGLEVLSSSVRTIEEHKTIIKRMDRMGSVAGHSYGIHGNSMLARLTDFDYIQRLGQDHYMHDELEGNFRRHCLGLVLHILQQLGMGDIKLLSKKWKEFRESFRYQGHMIATPELAIRNKTKKDFTLTKLAFSGTRIIYI